MKGWWFREAKFTNFGDELGPIILNQLGYKITRGGMHEADVIPGGSVLQAIETHVKRGAIIWGCGYISDINTLKHPSMYKYNLVRGPLSLAMLNQKGKVDCPVGDPALLVSRLWPASGIEYEHGWVPHYVDGRPQPEGSILINVKDDPLRVVEMISKCALITTSSLHASIVARAYGREVTVSHHPNVTGGDFKFKDFQLGFNAPIEDMHARILGTLP